MKKFAMGDLLILAISRAMLSAPIAGFNRVQHIVLSGNGVYCVTSVSYFEDKNRAAVRMTIVAADTSKIFTIVDFEDAVCAAFKFLEEA